MTKRVYVETTISSYLAAWPSRDIVQAARQQITYDWWNCQHIANAAIMRELGKIVAQCGFEMPILCTPEELPGD